MISLPKKIFPFLLMGAADLFTWIPLALFVCFLFFGPLVPLAFHFDHVPLLIFNLLLSLLFFFQHSLMIRKSFHAWLSRWIPPAYHRALFAMLSGLTILVVVLFWQPSQVPVFNLTGIFRWSARGVFLVSIAGFLWSGRILKDLDTSGVKGIKQYLTNPKPTEKPTALGFTVTGPYRWVRHPLYFFTLLMIWSFPDMTTDRLLFNVLWSGWIVVGAHLEETDLLETFGEPYRKYQKQVPMLIPDRIKPVLKAWEER